MEAPASPETPRQPRLRGGPAAYVAAFALVLVAFAVSVGTSVAFDTPFAFFPFLLAVAVAAFRSGAYVGIAATALSIALAGLFLFPPFASASVAIRADQIAIVLFAVEGLAISALGEFTRRLRVRGERQAAEAATRLDRERLARSQAERAITRSAGLEATAAALGRALSTDEVAEVAVREGLARLGAGRGVVGILQPDGNTIRTTAAVGFDQELLRKWPTLDFGDELPMAEAMRTREPIIIESAEELAARYPKADAGPGGPAVVVPLLFEDRAIGVLYFRYASADATPEGDRPYLMALGRQVASALERARLHERSANRLRGQEAVARLGQAAVVHHELEPLFEAAARELAEVLDGDITAIMQHVPGRGALRIVAGSGWREGVVGRAVIPDNAGSHSGFALISDGPVVSTDYAAETRFRASPIVLEHGARSGVTTPIVGPDGPWGVLGVHSRTPGRFDPDQIALLDTFANVLGSAISRRAVEIAVRDRDDRLELALAASRTGFWEWNVQTGRIHWSDEICRLHGMPPGTELPSIEAYLELVHEDDREWVGERIRKAAETGAFDGRFRILLPDGRVRWTHGTAKVFFDPQRRAVRMIGVGRDVTEEVELEAERLRMVEAERRQAELNQAFIGVVSHELRTPITSIFAGSKLLRRMSDAQAEKRSELMTDIEAEAERLYRLTEDLLVLTRVERGTLDIGMEPVAMPRVLERVIGSEQERWPLTTIELLVQPGIPIARGDNTYIEQLIRNLVGNAAKYAPQGGIVQVLATSTQASAPDGPEIEIRVLDQGPGLAEEDLEHLFDLFYRSPLTAKKAPGAGIGLFVSKHLAQAMGGRLWAHNRPEGGAEFGFSLLPYSADDGRANGTSARDKVALPDDEVVAAGA